MKCGWVVCSATWMGRFWLDRKRRSPDGESTRQFRSDGDVDVVSMYVFRLGNDFAGRGDLVWFCVVFVDPYWAGSGGEW